MNNNEVNTIESIIKDEDILNLEIVCEKEYLTKSQLEEQLILLIIYKMYYEHSFNLPIKIEDIQKYGTKLHELFTKLDLPCNHFNKVPGLEIYDELKTYLISIGIALAVGGLSALLTSGNMNLYEEIITPPLSPPSWVFPVVWTVLFILMGISAAMIYLDRFSPTPQKKSALYTYALSLIVNFFWSIIFFNMRAFLFAFIWLLLLLYLIIRTIMKYYKVLHHLYQSSLHHKLFLIYFL